MEEFIRQLAQLTKDFDPYGFADGFDSLEEAEKSVMDTIKAGDFGVIRDSLEEVRDFGESEEIAKAIELLEKLDLLEDFAAQK